MFSAVWHVEDNGWAFCLFLVYRTMLVLGRVQSELGATGKEVQSPPCLRTPAVAAASLGRKSASVASEGENVSLSCPTSSMV